MGTQLPLPKGAQLPQFSAHICCGQMAGWMKMPLGRKVGLDPSDIVLDWDPAPLPLPKKGVEPPNFRQFCCGQMAAWINMPFDMKLGRGPGHIVLHGDSAPPKKGTDPQFFRPMSIVAKRSPISATAEHLLNLSNIPTYCIY